MSRVALSTVSVSLSQSGLCSNHATARTVDRRAGSCSMDQEKASLSLMKTPIADSSLVTATQSPTVRVQPHQYVGLTEEANVTSRQRCRRHNARRRRGRCDDGRRPPEQIRTIVCLKLKGRPESIRFGRASDRESSDSTGGWVVAYRYRVTTGAADGPVVGRTALAILAGGAVFRFERGQQGSRV